MRGDSLNTFTLPVKNLRKKFARTSGLVIATALISFIFFADGILLASLGKGLSSMKSRMGADLMVVPLGYDKGMESLLLRGEPSYFYLDKKIESRIKNVRGVKKVSSQFFLVSLDKDCCAIPVQLIGFDPTTDFSVQPWISKVYGKSVRDDELVVGSDISVDEKKSLEFFGKDYPVVAQLERTGTGLDQAVFANMKTLSFMFNAAKDQGLTFIKGMDPSSFVSSILILIEDGFSAEQVVHNIRATFDGLQVVKTKTMIHNIAGALNTFSAFLFAFTSFFFLASLIMLVIVFSLSANERKKEFSTLRLIGATGKRLSFIVLTEAALVSAAGGLLGTLAGLFITVPLTSSVSSLLALPSMQPPSYLICLTALAAVLLSLVLGTLASLHAAIRLGRREVYLSFREGE